MVEYAFEHFVVEIWNFVDDILDNFRGQLIVGEFESRISRHTRGLAPNAFS